MTASVSPTNATDKMIVWTSSNPEIVNVLGNSNDTVCEIFGRSLGEAMIYATAREGGVRDSCLVNVRQQYVYLETDTTHVNGEIELSLYISSGVLLTGSFELQLPNGFGLTKGEVSRYRTSLTDKLKDIYDLKIDYVNDSTYTFTITPVTTPLSNQTNTKTKLLSIIYTIFDNDLDGSDDTFIVRIVDVVFGLSDGLPPVEIDMMSVEIKPFRDPTANEMIGNVAVYAHFYDNRLYVNTDKAETISVYALNGALLFTGNKKEGQAMFNMTTPEQILIVRGSSGWANKVVKK